MSKFNIKNPSTKTVNMAGGEAFKFDVQTELVHAVLTTFLDDKYYEKGKDRIARIARLVKENNPEFVAKLAVVARTEFNLRSVSTLLIAELAKVHKGDSLVKNTIIASTVRVDDLTELIACVGTPIPKQVKRGIRNALFKFDRYQLAKYKGEGKGVSLVDIFNLVHPKPEFASDEQKLAWKDLMEGNLKSFDTWEVELAGAKDDTERREKLSELIMSNKIGYMALLRNINNIIKYGCSTEVIAHAASRISDKNEVSKSKQLPFRYSTAFENVKGNRVFSDAIVDAMEHALSNVPELPGSTLIAVDTSGSMSGNPIKIASLFAATLAKSNPNADIIQYNTNVSTFNISSRSTIIDIAKYIQDNANGGGTRTSLVFEYALQIGKKYDRFIIISDNESWGEGYGGVQNVYNQYKNVTNTDPFIYAIDIAGYGTKDISSSKVTHLGSWSDRILDFIGENEKNLVSYISSKQI